MTFGGIYRDVQIRTVSQNFIENIFAKPQNILQENRSVNVRVLLNGKANSKLKLTAELLDGEKVIATQDKDVTKTDFEDITLNNLGKIELWDLDKPKLYSVRVILSVDGKTIDHDETRIGFREAKFTPEGFYSNRAI